MRRNFPLFSQVSCEFAEDPSGILKFVAVQFTRKITPAEEFPRPFHDEQKSPQIAFGHLATDRTVTHGSENKVGGRPVDLKPATAGIDRVIEGSLAGKYIGSVFLSLSAKVA